MKKLRKNSTRKQKIILLLFILFCMPIVVHAIEFDSAMTYTNPTKPIQKKQFIHKVGVGYRAEYIVATNPFLAGANRDQQPIKQSTSIHLRYAFQSAPGSHYDKIFGYCYQGIGMAGYKFGRKEEIGDPYAVYLFQGAPIVRIGRRLSLNYEWNFGISYGWKPYDVVSNEFNIMMGSKMNAYLNVNFLLEWMVSRHIDLQAGFAMTHFSNGNTEIPNAGMNSTGVKVGLTYNFGRDEISSTIGNRKNRLSPKFKRHISYDVMFFGSWCRNVAFLNDTPIPSPHKYTVVGFNFSPMYNFNQKLRLGVSVDGVYNGSANIYTEDFIVGTAPGYTFYSPEIKKQLSLGFSVRGEYVMPYFTVGLGVGFNALHKSGNSEVFYQIVALKIAVTRSSFIHIGYCLRDFQTPNYLMLGVGYRFNNKSPRK